MNKVALIAIVAMSASASAHADPVKVHLEGAGVFEGGGRGLASEALRGYLGVSLQQPGDGARGFIGAGVHGATGVLEVSDPRATDGTLEVQYETVGPEARLGAVFVDGGYVDTQLYVAIAPVMVGVDRRLVYDGVAGIHGGRGVRLAVGATYADRLYGAATRSIEAGDRSGLGALLVLLPTTFEITRETTAGSTRTGASFGWGF